MATFVGNRAIKRLALEDYEVITGPFSGRTKVASDLVHSNHIETTQRRFIK
jgi:hypothetical protein